MRRQTTLRPLFASITLACAFADTFAAPAPVSIFPLTVTLIALLFSRPWLFGHGG